MRTCSGISCSKRSDLPFDPNEPVPYALTPAAWALLRTAVRPSRPSPRRMLTSHFRHSRLDHRARLEQEWGRP